MQDFYHQQYDTDKSITTTTYYGPPPTLQVYAKYGGACLLRPKLGSCCGI